jgi:Flp pilus assembly pilin Flp
LRREVSGMERIKKELAAFLKEEDGVGVIEIVLILVVLIGLVIIFKKQITTLLNNVFKEINSQSKEVY